jgi:hypothetical protein
MTTQQIPSSSIQTVFIDNAKNNPPLADTEPDHLDENLTTEFNTTPQSLDELINAEVHCIETLQQSHGAFTESRWASYLDIDPMKDDTNTTSIQTPGGVEWFTTAAEQRAIRRAKNRERGMDKRKRRTEILTWLSEESQHVKEERTTQPHMEVVESAVLRKQKETETYANTWRNRRTMIALIKSYTDTAAAHILVNSEHRLTALCTKLDHLRSLATETPSQDSTPSIHYTNTVTDQEFSIQCGENNSLRMTSPFTDIHIAEHLPSRRSRLSIGTSPQHQPIYQTTNPYLSASRHRSSKGLVLLNTR